MRRTAEQRVVERGDIGARHRNDDNPAKGTIRRLPTLADGEVRLEIATPEAAGAQRPDEGGQASVPQRAKIFAAGMIEIAIDRENPCADQFATSGTDDPGRGNLAEAFDLSGNPLVQRFFLGAELRIRHPGKQIVDARGDERVRVEDLGRILLGDGNRLGERRPGGVVTRLV